MTAVTDQGRVAAPPERNGTAALVDAFWHRVNDAIEQHVGEAHPAHP
ncbi:hypothetical protein [Streptomyces sp. NBC_01207]|nr:hypothetical protein OG457_27590 [Streptomyces sp. NBC_01207]